MAEVIARSHHRIMSRYEYAEIVAQCALHGPAVVREWVDSNGQTHPLGGIHPVALLTAWSSEGWDLVTATTYGNLRVYTVRRPVG
jgi:phage portal protein BeeE